MGSIRFLLALAVVVVHVAKAPFHLGVNSLLAVEGFYAISGFLIAFVWDVKYSKEPDGIRSFYANRAARIYFLYWTVLGLTLLAGVIFRAATGKWPLYLSSDISSSLQILLYWLVSNLTLAGSSIAYWLGAENGSLYFTSDYISSAQPVWGLLVLGPAWTLELELCFYLLAPLILRLRLPWIVGLCLASFALRFGWYQIGHDVDPWNYRFFPFELGVFLMGAIAYRISKSVRPGRLISIAAYIVTVIAVGAYLPPYLANHRFVYLIIFAAVLPMIFELTKNWPADQFLADMSFPLYLAHWPVVLLLRDQPSVVQILVSVLSAALLVVYVERPIDSWRHSRVRTGRKEPDAGPILANAPIDTRVGAQQGPPDQDTCNIASTGYIAGDTPQDRLTTTTAMDKFLPSEDLMTEVNAKAQAKPLSVLQIFVVKVAAVLVAACLFLAFAISYVRSELEDPGIFKGGPAFWQEVENKLYKLADAKDLPEEKKAKILEALRKVSVKYGPYIEALTPPPRKENR
jgi:peptidoglycan/LPS O-acetylase OafA/YrhL